MPIELPSPVSAMYYTLQKHTVDGVIRVQGEEHVTGELDRSGALAAICMSRVLPLLFLLQRSVSIKAYGFPDIFPDSLGLESLSPGALSLVTGAGFGRGSGAFRPSSDSSSNDPTITLAFEPNKSFTIKSAEFTLQIAESIKVDVPSSAAAASEAGGALDTRELVPSIAHALQCDDELGTAPANVLISRSMTDTIRVETYDQSHCATQGQSSPNSRHTIVLQDMVLDTPALETRYVDPRTFAEESATQSDAEAAASPELAHILSRPQRLNPESLDEDGEANYLSISNTLEENPNLGRASSAKHESTPAGRSVRDETPDPTEDSPMLRVATPSEERPAGEEMSRKRKRPKTYSSVTRGSTKKSRDKEPVADEDMSVRTEANTRRTSDTPSMSSTIAPTAVKGGSHEMSSKSSGSKKSKRILESSEDSLAKCEGPAPQVVFSNSDIPHRPKFMKFLKKQNVQNVDAVSETTDFVCVGNGELKRTSKLTLAVLLGKNIVTDKWVTDSFNAGRLLDPADYLPKDAHHEDKWQFSLRAAVERGKQGLKIFRNWTLYLTPNFVRDAKVATKELAHMARTAGAKVFPNKLPMLFSTQTQYTLIVGADYDDQEFELSERGWTLYSKEIISLSILRGRLEVDNEDFRIKSRSRSSQASKEKKGR